MNRHRFSHQSDEERRHTTTDVATTKGNALGTATKWSFGLSLIGDLILSCFHATNFFESSAAMPLEEHGTHLYTLDKSGG